jgi:hypothetical protein
MMEKLIPQNEHIIDRVVRVALGLTLLMLTVVGPQSAWGFLGIIPLVTGMVGSCPLYRLVGVNTCNIGSPRNAAQH